MGEVHDPDMETKKAREERGFVIEGNQDIKRNGARYFMVCVILSLLKGA